MTCVAIDENQMAINHDYEIALSLNLNKCSLRQWDKQCAKACGPSHSSCEGSGATCSASCAASCSSMPVPGLAIPLKGKVCWADWDDKTTNPSPRSSMSLCDEAAENELKDYDLAEDELADFDFAENGLAEESLPAESELDRSTQIKSSPPSRVAWADLADSASEDGTTSIQANTSESEDEVEVCHSSSLASSLPKADDEDEASKPRSARSRASRRVSARAATEGEEPRSHSAPGKGNSGAFTASYDRAERDDSTAHKKGANKGAGNGNGKGASKGNHVKGSNKGDRVKSLDKVAGKGADKGAGKSRNDSDFGKGASKGAGKGFAKGKGKGKAKGNNDGANNKFQCQIIVGIEEDSRFRVVRRLIGSGGENMKNINQQSGARLRLRGRGSKFLEGFEQQESTDDLMLCITCDDKDSYEVAKEMAVELVESIHNSYRAFCRSRGKDFPDLEVRLHEGYRPGSR